MYVVPHTLVKFCAGCCDSESEGSGKGKGKAKLPSTCHEGMRESGYMALHILMSVLDGSEWVRFLPWLLCPEEKSPRYPFNRTLGRP